MSERINFYKEDCTTQNITEPKFGLIDPGAQQKVRVDFCNDSLWEAVVDNRSGKPLNFTAIDNCIDIYREDGNMDNRCDGMLTGAGYIVFVELKNVEKRSWITDSVDRQLQPTIEKFIANHDISGFKKKFAYVCNKSHPQFKSSRMELMNDFYRRNGVRLCIVNEIVIK